MVVGMNTKGPTRPTAYFNIRKMQTEGVYPPMLITQALRRYDSSVLERTNPFWHACPPKQTSKLRLRERMSTGLAASLKCTLRRRDSLTSRDASVNQLPLGKTLREIPYFGPRKCQDLENVSIFKIRNQVVQEPHAQKQTL